MLTSVQPTVSIVMAAYNLGQFVGATIESVLRQTFADFEFIIIDNGSEDNTAAIIHSFHDSRIRLLSEEINLGPALAVNRAIDASHGKYLALLAADDLWAPEKLARQVAFLNDNPQAGAVFSAVQLIDEEGRAFTDSTHCYYNVFKQPNRTRHEWLRHLFQYGNCLCAVSSLVRRSSVTGDWYRSEMLQLSDIELWIRILLEFEIHLIQEKLTYYRIRSGEANTSAPRLDAAMRCAFETFTRVAVLFIRPPVLDDVHLIFPEIGALTAGRSDSLKKWHLASLFIEHNWEPWRLFGLTLQSDLLANTASREELIGAVGPSVFSKHFRAVGVASPLGAPPCRAQIYWPFNGSFEESRSISQSYEDGTLARTVFSIPIREGESAFRFDPCDGIGTVYIREVVLRSKSEHGGPFTMTNADLLSHDGCVRIDPEGFRFATIWNPQMVFRLPPGLSGKEVTVEVSLMHSNSTVEVQSALTALRTECHALRHRIELYNRRSWLHRALRKLRF